MATKLWRRVGRNTDLLSKQRAEKLLKMRRVGRGADFDDEDPDLVEVMEAGGLGGRKSGTVDSAMQCSLVLIWKTSWENGGCVTVF